MFNKIKGWLAWRFGRPRNLAGSVYYVRLRTPQGVFYKLGYTTKPTLFERMAYANCGDEKLIDKEFFFTFHATAWEVEQTLLKHFDRQRAFGKFSKDASKPLCGRGQSELFANDVLGLDADLYKLADKEILTAMRNEVETAKDGCLLILIGIVFVPFTLGLSLLFLIGGASGLIGFGRHHQPDLKPGARPVHPARIQELIDVLVGDERRAAGGARSGLRPQGVHDDGCGM